MSCGDQDQPLKYTAAPSVYLASNQGKQQPPLENARWPSDTLDNQLYSIFEVIIIVMTNHHSLPECQAPEKPVLPACTEQLYTMVTSRASDRLFAVSACDSCCHHPSYTQAAASTLNRSQRLQA